MVLRLLLTIVAFASVSCLAAQPLAAERLAAEGKEAALRIALSSSPFPMDPATAPSVEQAVFAFAAYENLVRRRRGEGPGPEFVPERAASWQRSDDGLTWRFEIAPGGRFASGEPVNAEAVAYSLRRLLALGRGPSSRAAEVIADVATEAPMRLRLTLHRPEPRLLAILADRACSIIDPKVQIHAKNGDWGSSWLSSQTAGSGPYDYQESLGVGIYVLERNAYYAGDPFFDRLIFREVKDPIARALAAGRGEVDIAVLMPAPALRQAEGQPEVVERSSVTDAYQNLAFNLDRETFSDVRLRRAVALAIDTDAIIANIREGRALPSYGPGSQTPQGYDLGEAARLAREALGDQRLTVKMIYPGVSPDTDTVAQYIQAQLATLGIRVRLERLSIGAYLSRISRGAYDLVLSGFVAIDSDVFAIAEPWYNSESPAVQNPARFANGEVDRLLKALRGADQAEDRRRIASQIAGIVDGEVPYVYLQQTMLSFLVRQEIEGFSVEPTAALDFPYTEMSRAP